MQHDRRLPSRSWNIIRHCRAMRTYSAMLNGAMPVIEIMSKYSNAASDQPPCFRCMRFEWPQGIDALLPMHTRGT